MPKPYSVSPRKPANSSIFIATFYNSAGVRITRSLGTDLEDDAKTICVGLVTLRNAGVRTLEEALALKTFVSPDCYPLFFAESEIARDENAADMPTALTQAMRHLNVGAIEVHVPAEVHQKQVEIRKVMGSLREQAAKWKASYELSEKTRADEGRSRLAHAAKASANAPALSTVRDPYEKHLKATVQKPRSYLRPFDKFLVFLKDHHPTVTNVADVTPGHISGFLDVMTDLEDLSKKAIRRKNLRTYTGRFFNWCAQTYEIPSPMSGVKTVKKRAIRRERGDIDWHSLEEIQTALKALPERAKQSLPQTKKTDRVSPADLDYWQALVRTLSFAGLQLAELCWLRKEDLVLSQDKKRATLWITTVPDPGDSKMRHLLKTDNRQRHVDVHPQLLLPWLSKRKSLCSADDYFLFPMPAKRKRKGFKECGGRWNPTTLSTFLRGHPGGVDRKKTLGLLPKGMTPLSLRRTFGSLLVRSGKSTEQVAAAMGNTPEVVREHYAKILGCEVDVDF